MRGKPQLPSAPHRAGLTAATWLLLAPSLAPAAAAQPVSQPGPELTAVAVATAPLVDGRVLDDPAWSEAPAMSSFWQTTPDEGQPASERTEVRVLYTKETLYVGVVCHDREPDRIIVSDARRDAPLDDGDSFQLILDTFLDRQSGFVFGTNPAGVEHDGQVTREGEEGDRSVRQQASAGGGFNVNWDAAWTVRAQVGDFGWSAEFAIPFRTLRYPRGGAQVWGLNLQRNIRRRKETAFWARLPRQYNLYRVSAAGLLRGVEVPGQRNLKLTPYALARAARRYPAGGSWNGDADAGGDLKYSLTPGLTLDATVNTDFAQVEVDEQQITLDRFNVFFPEKRPFFLENAGLFAMGTPGEVDLFFSRRIGIGEAGDVVPILGGVRLSGRVGGASVGLLNMQTRSAPGEERASNLAVARLGWELPRRSGLGVLFVNRQATGAGPTGVFNRTVGADGRWGFGRFGQVAGFAARTFTPGLARGQHAFHLGTSWNSPAWEVHAKYTEVGEGFNPEVGFLRRRGFRKPDVLVFHRWRPTGLIGLHEVRPHASYRGYWKPDGFHETGFAHFDCHWEWKNGYEFHTGLNLTREGLVAPFEVYPGILVPPGTYDHREVQLVFMTNEAAPVSFRAQANVGGFLGGRRTAMESSLRGRAGEAFTAELSWGRNDVTLPAGDFLTNLLRVRLSYSFGPRLFVQSLVQYNDLVDRWSTNLRIGWLQTANTGLFVVFNESRATAGAASAAGLRDRSVVLKVSRLVDLLD